MTSNIVCKSENRHKVVISTIYQNINFKYINIKNKFNQPKLMKIINQGSDTNVIMRNYKLKQVWNTNLLIILHNLIETSRLSQMQIIKICTVIFTTQSTSFVSINCREFYLFLQRDINCINFLIHHNMIYI